MISFKVHHAQSEVRKWTNDESQLPSNIAFFAQANIVLPKQSIKPPRFIA